MKFSLLPVGAKFEYEGKLYVKANPMIASEVEGEGQRSIPRSANVVLDGADAKTGENNSGKTASTIEQEEFLKAVNALQYHLKNALNKNLSITSEKTAMSLQLDAAISELLEKFR